MLRGELRGAISRPGAYPSIASADILGGVLSPEISDHIRAVYERLERTAGDEHELALPLRLAVLVHEEPPARLPAFLERFGMSDLAPIVIEVIGAFGRLWKLSSDQEAVTFIDSHRGCLVALLLFELAHEGAPTASMGRIARLAGLERRFARWVNRLEHPVLSPGGLSRSSARPDTPSPGHAVTLDAP